MKFKKIQKQTIRLKKWAKRKGYWDFYDAVDKLEREMAEKNGILISQLEILTPAYYKSYVEKYGNESFSIIDTFVKQTPPPNES